jgi:CBS domain-containing protein
MMTGEGTPDIHHRALTAAMLSKQQTDEPVHRWAIMEKSSGLDDWQRSYQTVGQFMSTDLFTVRPDDLVDLAAGMMDWKHVRHMPVEDDEGRLVGLVSLRNLLHLMVRGSNDGNAAQAAVRTIMKSDPVTVTPDTPTLEAIALMRRHNVGCLPVVEADHLVGIVTAYDFLAVSARLFEEHLSTTESPPQAASASA